MVSFTCMLSSVTAVLLAIGPVLPADGSGNASSYDGKYCKGTGDADFLRIIDRSFSCLHPNPDLPNISFVYSKQSDTLIEGETWTYWWIQNSFGGTYCSGPFAQEPWATLLQQSMDLWFKWQGDGKTVNDYWGEIGPDGCLCDAARSDTTFFRQGDAFVHLGKDGKNVEWGVGFTAVGVIMQADRLLINRDRRAIDHYLPKLERACDFIESYRDPKNNLFLVGFAADLLAPSSVIGRRLPDGSLEKGYLAELSIDYVAALDRMIELFKMVGGKAKAEEYESRRQRTLDALPQVLTPEGYFVKSIDLTGTKHGVYGQDKYGYFVASPNINAVCFRVIDDATSRSIYNRIASIPGLRPHTFIITNYPSLDDTLDYDSAPTGLMVYGLWTNGGAWPTEEARAIMTYYRVGAYEDVRRSFSEYEKHAANFRVDDHFKEFGSQLWFENAYTSFCYGGLGIPAAVARGLFEYVYKADSLVLYPHIPPSITKYEQKAPIRFGGKLLYLKVDNGGRLVVSLRVNGKAWKVEPSDHVELLYNSLPAMAKVELVTSGGQKPTAGTLPLPGHPNAREIRPFVKLPDDMQRPYDRLVKMHETIGNAQGCDYAKSFLSETIAAFDAWTERANRQYSEFYPDMPMRRRGAVLKMYKTAAMNMSEGFSNTMERYSSNTSSDEQQRLARLWAETRGITTKQ